MTRGGRARPEDQGPSAVALSSVAAGRQGQSVCVWAAGLVIDRLGLTINGSVLPIPLEAGIMLTFGLVMLAIAVVSFQRRD